MKTLIYMILAIFFFVSCEKSEKIELDHTYYRLPDNKTITIKIVNMSKDFAEITGGVLEGDKWYYFGDTTYFYQKKYTIPYGESITFKTHYLRYKICLDINKRGMPQIESVSGWIGASMQKFTITDNIVLKSYSDWE